LGIELEAKEQASVLDVAELDLEPDARAEQTRPVGGFGFVRLDVYEHR
jgi:hypothetical protein